MRSLKLYVFNIILSLSLSLLFVSSVNAQGVNDFIIKDFNAVYNLTNADPQGELTVKEEITVNFKAQNRGILRALPEKYEDQKLNVQIISIQRDGKNEQFTTYKENNNTVIRIGDPNVYITGEHTYLLSYRIENVIKFYDDYDEFYWDINGDQWLQTFNNVSVVLNTNANIKKGIDAICFTGSYGKSDKNCTITQTDNGLEVSTSRPLSSSETLTVIQAYEKGFFTPPSSIEKYWTYLAALPIILLQFWVLRKTHIKWEEYGKDYKKRANAPFFGRPKNVSVMQASYVSTNSLVPMHISAAIIDLAIRGYIKIIESGKGRKVKHEIVAMKDLGNNLFEDEKTLLNDLFSGFSVGKTIGLEDKKNKLYNTLTKLQTDIDNSMKSKGFYELSPKKSASKLGLQIALAVLSLVIAVAYFFWLENPVPIVTGVLVLIIVLVYSGLMTKRSQSGVELAEHMDGLKLYLGFSEKDRIAAQDAVEAPLAPRAGQPVRDVKFFEKLLPFAVALGVEKTWSKAFSDIYVQPPDWYSGNWTTFNTVALASSLNNISSSTAQSFSAPSSSGSSGFSGGGFSGGGGGGGGGGGW